VDARLQGFALARSVGRRPTIVAHTLTSPLSAAADRGCFVSPKAAISLSMPSGIASPPNAGNRKKSRQHRKNPQVPPSFSR
jgi:hypothetical protein